ncbi:hypothetical protein LRS10_22585 [Phenylobacterium sp. J426]|uniref:hypothetical protein n=1 Tax=Phenylobacterium sp. J426 TaxID=2898439 RepID=UPI0021515538|nr:hypothetical protein [Phenylobacterium sp. J426]MCR5876697.1 hypothetical protein [Phenylobacterium sp. J426]
MSSNSTSELIGIALFLLFAGVAGWLWDQPWRRGLRHPVADRFADRAEAMLSEVFADARSAEPHGDENGDDLAFRARAQRELAPRLDALVARLNAHGVRAEVRRPEAGGADDPDEPLFVLEIARPHRVGAPPATLSFRPGEGRDLLVVYGGDVSGPQNHNGHDAQVGWREIDWDDVEPALLKFTARVIKGD